MYVIKNKQCVSIYRLRTFRNLHGTDIDIESSLAGQFVGQNLINMSSTRSKSDVKALIVYNQKMFDPP